MPEVKPHDLKADSTIALEPDRLSSKMQVIIDLDICGYTGNQIAEQVGLTPSRVSIIRNSPVFVQERDRRRETLSHQVLEKKSDAIVTGDPVENKIKSIALKAVGVYEDIIDNGKGEMAKIASASHILDRAGYKAKTDRTVLSVEVTEKMANRFERVLKRSVDGTGQDVGDTEVRITRTVSSQSV